jgi:hypothetical protein
MDLSFPPGEVSLEDKYQASFNQLWANSELDKNRKYYFFYWFADMKTAIKPIGWPLTEKEQKYVDDRRQVIEEYSYKRCRWELSRAINLTR